MKRYDIINFFIGKFNYKKYLEIGVQGKDNFRRVLCNYKFCVDPEKKYDADFIGTSDEFFCENREFFDIVFIDGLHYEKQVIKDVQNSLKFLNKQGTIICHDMLPVNEIEQIVPMQKTNFWTGDCWKAWFYFLKNENFEMFVVDTDNGVGVIRSGKQEKIKVVEEMNWNFFIKNKYLMNIISIEQLKEKFLKEKNGFSN